MLVRVYVMFTENSNSINLIKYLTKDLKKKKFRLGKISLNFWFFVFGFCTTCLLTVKMVLRLTRFCSYESRCQLTIVFFGDLWKQMKYLCTLSTGKRPASYSTRKRFSFIAELAVSRIRRTYYLRGT